MIVKVLIATEGGIVKICEVYSDVMLGAVNIVDKRFDDLKQMYGGANVCMASREVKEFLIQ